MSEELLIVQNEIETIINAIVEELEFSKSDAIELFTEYLESIPELITGLDEAVRAKDFESVDKIAHTLKGSSANLRVENLFSKSATMCEAAKNKDIETCSLLLLEIKKHLDVLNSLLLKFVPAAS